MKIQYVPRVMEEIDEVVRLIPLERVQQRTVEQIVHVPVPQVVEETARVVQIIPRSVSRAVSSTESSMSQLRSDAKHCPSRRCRKRRRFFRFSATGPAGAEDSRDAQQQFIDKMVEDLVMMQIQVPAAQVAQKTVEVSPIQLDIPVVHTGKGQLCRQSRRPWRSHRCSYW